MPFYLHLHGIFRSGRNTTTEDKVLLTRQSLDPDGLPFDLTTDVAALATMLDSRWDANVAGGIEQERAESPSYSHASASSPASRFSSP